MFSRSSSPRGFPGGSDSKEPVCNTGDTGSIPGSGRSPGERNGYPIHDSSLENSMARGTWWTIVCGVTKSQTQLSTCALYRHKEMLLKQMTLQNIKLNKQGDNTQPWHILSPWILSIGQTKRYFPTSLWTFILSTATPHRIQLSSKTLINGWEFIPFPLLAFMVAQKVKNQPAMQETRVRILSQEDPLEKGMATHSSILAWEIPWTQEPGRL